MESINRSSGKSDRWTLFAVLAFFLGVVGVPIAKAYWPSERARWLVAAAENALKKGTDEQLAQAKQLLDEAVKSYPEIQKSPDFIRVSFPLPPDSAIKLIQSLPPDQRPFLANVLAQKHLDIRDFDAAYEILSAGTPAPSLRSPIQRNQLAYFAALANRDLELALEDIEKALAEKKIASYLDTKAWVLFRLKRFDEALVAIDLSLESAINEIKTDLKNAPFQAEAFKKIQDLLNGNKPFVKRPFEDTSDPLASFSEEFANILKTIVVLHYHRGEILEALGNVEEADKEYTWVQNRGFNDFERLY
jgi:tetratricopeptide (TPR) repeat protein